jgi:very-short-patch-repair endonuclease
VNRGFLTPVGANLVGRSINPVMTGRILQSIWRLVDRQHGVVARWQLLELGVTRHAIDHRISTGRLHPIHRGVYAVGRPQLTQEGRWMAAVLACGREAALSHRSAAALWQLVPRHAGAIEIAVPAELSRNRPGIRVHRRILSNGDVAQRLGIPVIAVVPTLVDLAAVLSRDALEAAISEADKRDLVDPEALRFRLEAYRGRPGVAILRRTLDRHTFRPTDSWLERRFLPIARRAGLSTPDTRRYANGWRVDFYWADLGLVVETHGLRYHRTPAQQARDLVREHAHAVAGQFPLAFSYDQVRHEPAYVERTLKGVVARLREAA